MNTPTKLDVAINYDSHGSQRQNQYTFPIAQKIGWDLKMWIYMYYFQITETDVIIQFRSVDETLWHWLSDVYGYF